MTSVTSDIMTDAGALSESTIPLKPAIEGEVAQKAAIDWMASRWSKLEFQVY